MKFLYETDRTVHVVGRTETACIAWLQQKQAEEPLGRGVGIKKTQIKLFRRDLLSQARKVCVNKEEGD